MKTLIVYATQYGCTEAVAQEIAAQLTGECIFNNLKQNANPALASYDKIIVGGSIYAGNIQKEVKDFCTFYEDLLLQKPLGIFLCGMGFTQTGVANSFEFSFNQKIREHAKIMDMVGGVLNYEKMKFADKLIIKTVTRKMIKYAKDETLQNGKMPTNTLDHRKIAAIANVMNKY